MKLLDAAAETLGRSGYGLMLRRSGAPPVDLVDAHIVVDPAESDEVREREQRVPVVTIGRTRLEGVPWVDVDHEKAMLTLLSHLSERASDGSAWFVTLPEHLAFVDALEGAFRNWAGDQGRDIEVLQTGNSAEGTVEVIRTRLEAVGAPSLIVTALEGQAVGAQHAINASGLNVAVGSASDGDALGLLVPPVSAMALDGAAHGRIAAQMLLDWIRTGEMPLNELLPARLRARQ